MHACMFACWRQPAPSEGPHPPHCVRVHACMQLGMRCLAEAPEDRPSADVLVRELAALEELMRRQGQVRYKMQGLPHMPHAAGPTPHAP